MKIETEIKEGQVPFGLSTFPASLETQNVPLSPDWKRRVKVFTPIKGGRDEPSEVKFFIHDGFFGATLFSIGKVWWFNYPKQALWYCDSMIPAEDFSGMDIFFRTKNGVRETHQPRMEIEVSGTKMPMLFDTGATSFFSKVAVTQLGSKTQINASSFIRESVARRWIKANPRWRVVDNGDLFGGGGFLIQVPKVRVAGHEVGPVWFATRKDSIYDKYSAEIMDASIDGAVGGNILKHFEVIADYPSSKLYFQIINPKK